MPIALTCRHAIIWAGLCFLVSSIAAAGPVAEFEFDDGSTATYELLDFSEGMFTLSDLKTLVSGHVATARGPA